jgi:hypothetical protein
MENAFMSLAIELKAFGMLEAVKPLKIPTGSDGQGPPLS